MCSVRIVSGGQTGVDQGALDFAMMVGFRWGGWAPRGWLDEYGKIPARYRFDEETKNGLEENTKGSILPRGAYASRTKRNVKETDGTLVLYGASISRGTQLTIDVCEKEDRPCLYIGLDNGKSWDNDTVWGVREWIQRNGIQILNVAGPRESKWKLGRVKAKEYLGKIFEK